MERLLQQFEQLISDDDGATYRVYLYGRSRPSDTWQGWLVFERLSDGQRFSTDVETTQPNAEAVLYWATGLTDSYFDGALTRARNPERYSATTAVAPVQVIDELASSEIRRERLADLERAVLACFHRHRTRRLLTQTLFDDLRYAHADIVRGLEDLEKQGRMLVRRTEEGNDWLFLTQAGAVAAGVADVAEGSQAVSREKTV